jgi:hypothetical protein
MFPVKCEVIGIKAEVTQNTAITLLATDYLLAQDVSVKPVQEYLPRDFKRGTLDKIPHVAAGIHVDVSFKMEIKNSGTAGTVLAPLSAALQASGMAETISAGVSVTYAPVSVPASTSFFTVGKSATIEYYEGATATKSGLKHIIKGCVASGGPKLVLEAGKIGMYEFTFRGLYTAVTDAVAPTCTYNTVVGPIIQSAAFALHGYAAIISKCEIDFGNVIAPRQDVNSADGLKGFAIIDRDPKGSVDPEGELVATFDLYGKMRTGAEGILTIASGATAGNITTISCPKAQFAGLDAGERDGMRTFAVPLKFNQSTGDDWISIVLT